jgi:hypothetical protein
VFQIQFAKRDGSIFVSFPYFEGRTGVVSLVHWPATDTPSTLVSLEPGGKVASHLVKYSHHPDGRAHFSQDGRVRTDVKKQAVPLDEIEGHLFSLHIQGIHGFEPAQESYKTVAPSPRRNTIRFLLEDPLPGSIKFVGRLHSSKWLQARAVNGILSPTCNWSSQMVHCARGLYGRRPCRHPDRKDVSSFRSNLFRVSTKQGQHHSFSLLVSMPGRPWMILRSP